MRKTLTGVMAAVVTSTVLTLSLSSPQVAGQTAAYRAPRLADGKPDLNGIWQALKEANYDLQAHIARPAMAVPPVPYRSVPAAAGLPLRAVGAVAPGDGLI